LGVAKRSMTPLSVPSIDQLRDLLGRYKHDPIVVPALTRCRLDDDPEVHLGAAHWYDSESGFSMRTSENGIVDTVFLYGRGKDDFAQYPGDLDSRTEFGMTPAEVRACSGEPSTSGLPGRTMLGAHGGWDRYDYPTYSIHYSYRHPDQQMELVTITYRPSEND